MKKHSKFVPWLTRLLLLPPTIIFTLIAARHIARPVQAAAAEGISLNSPLGITITRVGLGGFPLGCAIFTFFCLLSTRRILTGLLFVWNMVGVLLGVRVIGILADGTARQNLRLVGAEIGLLTIVTIGILLELALRREQLKVASEARI
jgi:hypothetical protein